MRRAVVVTAAMVGVIAAAGFCLQSRHDARITARHPPPGRFVDIGDHRLHYQLHGSGPVTFVLEAGAGEYSGSWGAVDDSLAKFSRVFVYDRAGLGWSEPGPRPRSLSRLASELRAALAAADVPPPYVFAGHSLGGAIVTRYAMDYPAQVSGLLLIEPSHPDQFARLSYPLAWQRRLATEALRLAPLGLSFLLPESPHPVKNRSGHLRAYGAELRAFMRTATRAIEFGEIPVTVLSRAPDDRDRERWEAWTALHAEFVDASTSEFSRHAVVRGAGHCIHCDRPAVVIDAALELMDVVTRVRAEAP